MLKFRYYSIMGMVCVHQLDADVHAKASRLLYGPVGCHVVPSLCPPPHYLHPRRCHRRHLGRQESLLFIWYEENVMVILFEWSCLSSTLGSREENLPGHECHLPLSVPHCYHLC